MKNHDPIKGSNCNDHIIQNNKFLRDFEGMYQNFSDPWNQNEEISRTSDLFIYKIFSRKLNTLFANREEGLDFLDIGCADGNLFNDFVKQGLITRKDLYLGIDISHTAINRAKTLIKNEQKKSIIYSQGDILNVENLIQDYGHKDIIFLFKTVYYLAPEIDSVITNLEKILNNNGVIFITYNFFEGCFTSRWLDPFILHKKFVCNNFKCHLFDKKLANIQLNNEEMYFMIYQKNNDS